jgi:AraC family transcriptional regulator
MQRLGTVIDYIHERLGDKLNVDSLARVAGASKFHFHRQFTAEFGISVYRYVQLARLKRAAAKLAYRPLESILDIALGSGYDGPEAFSRAFKQVIGQTPSEFRAEPHWQQYRQALQPMDEMRKDHMKQQWQKHDVGIVQVPDTFVAMLEHRGDPARIGETIRRFIAWRKSVKLSPNTSATYNILFDDPNETPADEFRLGICAATQAPVAPNDVGVMHSVIPGGRCAVLRHIGSDHTLGDAVTYLYATWLPESGEQLRDFPVYCQRVTFFPDVPEHEAITDIFLPLT